MAEIIIPAGPIVEPADAETIIPAGPIVEPKSEEIGNLDAAGRTVASGLTEGVAGVIGAPRMGADLTKAGTSWLGSKLGISDDAMKSGIEQVWTTNPILSMFGSAPSQGDVTQAASDATGGYTDYTPTSTTGKLSKEALTLAPGALLGGTGSLLSRLGYGAVAPAAAGLAAETAGKKASELTGIGNPEDVAKWSKLGAEIISPLAAQKLVGASKFGVDPRAQDAESVLKSAGIEPPTVGQLTGDPSILAREAGAIGFQQKIAKQGKSLMDFAYNKIGWTGKDVPNKVELEAIGKGFADDIKNSISGISYPIDASDISAIRTPDFIANIRGSGRDSKLMLSSILSEMLPGNVMTPQRINEIRSAAWEMSTDPNANRFARNAAIEIGKLADSVIEKRLSEAARIVPNFPADAYQAYRNARTNYANYIAVSDAIRRSGRPSAMSFDAKNLADAVSGVPGASDDIRSVSEAAVSYFLRHPEVARSSMMGKLHGLGQEAANAAMIGQASPIAGGASLAANMLSRVGSAFHPLTMTDLGQKAMRALSGRSATGTIGGAALPAGASYGAENANGGRVERKSGGRVDMGHEKAADRLVAAAERAKNGISKTTEPLLNMPDEHIASALEIANRSI